MGNALIQKVITMFITKKRMIGWGASVAFAILAAAAGMKTPEFKEAVCGAPELTPVSEVQK